MRTLLYATLVALATPALALAAAPRTLQDLANLIVQLLDSTTTVLIVAGIVVYFYGVSTNLFKVSEGSGAQKLRSQLIWGIVILFVMVSIWGIINLLQNTLFGGNSFNPTSGAPQSPQNQFQQPQFLQ